MYVSFSADIFSHQNFHRMLYNEKRDTQNQKDDFVCPFFMFLFKRAVLFILYYISILDKKNKPKACCTSYLIRHMAAPT